MPVSRQMAPILTDRICEQRGVLFAHQDLFLFEASLVIRFALGDKVFLTSKERKIVWQVATELNAPSKYMYWFYSGSWMLQ